MSKEEDRYWNKDVVAPGIDFKVGGGYKIVDTLKNTNFSIVYVADNMTTGAKEILKFIKRIKGKETMLENEVQLQRSFRHPGILPILDDFPFRQFHVVVFPYANNGSLEELLEKYRDGFSESVVKNIMIQLLRVLSHLHAANIVHGDIKLDNIMLFGDIERNNFTIKLSDFGLAQQIEPGRFLCENVGTKYYKAPEIFYGKKCIFYF